MFLFRKMYGRPLDAEIAKYMADPGDRPYPSKVEFHVGFYHHFGEWETVLECDTYQEAADEVHFLNGGEEVTRREYQPGAERPQAGIVEDADCNPILDPKILPK